MALKNLLGDLALDATLDEIKGVLEGTIDTADAAVLAKLEALRLLIDATLDIAGTVAVSNFPANQAVTGPLTDSQLRASAVPISGALTDSQLRASPVPVDVSDTSFNVGNLPADYPDAAALAKLELVRVLLAGTLAVAGTVSLDASTLSALETITAVVSGTVAVANFPASQAVAATDFDIRALALTEDNVRQTTRPMDPLSVTKTGPLTDDVLVAVPPGSRLRLLRNAGHCDPATALGTYPVIALKIGSLTFYADKLEAGLPWAETVCFEGADGEDLALDLTTTETVFLNMRYEIF